MVRLNIVSTNGPGGAIGQIATVPAAIQKAGYTFDGSGYLEFGTGADGSLPFRVDQSGNVISGGGGTGIQPSGDTTGATDWANIQTALLSFGTLGGAVPGQGGIVTVLPGQVWTNKPLIIPSQVKLKFAGPWASSVKLVTGSNCDVIQWATYNSAAQAAILGVSAASIGNAFYASLEDVTIHGDAFATTTAGYRHGINITMNPADTVAPSDPDFDPLPLISNVITEANTGDGYFHVGRSGGLLYRVTSQCNNGNGFTPSYDTGLLYCLANKNGVGGFYLNHSSVTGAVCKSYNNGQGNTSGSWISGHAYTAGQCVINAGTMYFCILATSGTTAPGGDPAHWTAVAATSPAAWGDGYYWDSNCLEHAWSAIDAQQNSASSYFMNGCACVNLQGTSSAPNFNGATNPNNYAHIQLISNEECNIQLTCSGSNSGAGGAYIYNFDKNFFSNQLVGTSDGTETAMFPTGQGGVFTVWNGIPTFLKAVPTVFFNVQANSYQDKAGTNCTTQGSGVPTNPSGANPVAGDVYFRTDTPTVANQRIYFCTVGGATPTWVGVV